MGAPIVEQPASIILLQPPWIPDALFPYLLDSRTERLWTENLIFKCIDALPFSAVPPYISQRDRDKIKEFTLSIQVYLPEINVYSISSEADLDNLDREYFSSAITAVSSRVQGFKGGAAGFIRKGLRQLGNRSSIAVSFGSPHLISGLEARCRVYAWYPYADAQRAAASRIGELL